MIWSEEEVALLAREIPSLYLDKADDAWYIADAVIESRWLLAHDAEIRTAALEEAAGIADANWNGHSIERPAVDIRASKGR